MSLTDDGNHISLLGMGDAVGNGFLPVRDFDEFSAGFLDAAADIRNDILHLLKAGVICSDDGKICHAAADLTHGITAVF